MRYYDILLLMQPQHLSVLTRLKEFFDRASVVDFLRETKDYCRLEKTVLEEKTQTKFTEDQVKDLYLYRTVHRSFALYNYVLQYARETKFEDLEMITYQRNTPEELEADIRKTYGS